MRRWIAALAVAALGVTAWADLATEVAELRTSIATRIEAIGDTPASRAEKREAKRLEKARVQLEAYTGADDVADLVLVGKALKRFYSSKTDDAAVRAEAADVVREACGVLEADVAAQDPAIDALLEKFVGKSRAAQDKVLGLLVDCETDPERTARRLPKAAKRLASLDRKVTKFTKKSQPKPVGVPSRGLEARITGDGVDETVRKKGVFVADEFGFFVQACIDPSGPEEVCRQVLICNMGAVPAVGQTGFIQGLSVDFGDSTDFQNGNGPGVQDLSWRRFNAPIEIVESSKKWIAGTFDVIASGSNPETVRIRGGFRVRRPR